MSFMPKFLNIFNGDKNKIIRNFVFQGGSLKGIAYIGALEILEKNNIKLEDIVNIGGTSVGAITASLLSVGYNHEALNTQLENIEFTKFIDIKDNKKKNFLIHVAENIDKGQIAENFSICNLLKILRCLKCIMDHKGLAEGEELRKWIEKTIKENTKNADKNGTSTIDNLTFGELAQLHVRYPKKYKLLYLFGTNLTTGKAIKFSHKDTPNVIISDAVRISASLPFIFKPHQVWKKIDGKRQLASTDLYVDGGIMHNYPIWLFDDVDYLNENEKTKDFNSETLGFRLLPLNTIREYDEKNISISKDSKETNRETREKRLFKSLSNGLNFLFSLFNCLYEKEESDYNLNIEKHHPRTICIEHRGISTFKFNLNEKEKNELIYSGKLAASNYILNKLKKIERTTSW